jgi:hypothetical protein
MQKESKKPMARTPKPRTERKDELIAAQVEAVMKRDLEEIAQSRDVPVAQIVREALKRYLDQAKRAA